VRKANINHISYDLFLESSGYREIHLNSLNFSYLTPYKFSVWTFNISLYIVICNQLLEEVPELVSPDSRVVSGKIIEIDALSVPQL